MDASGAAALGESGRLDLGELAALNGRQFCQAFVDQLARGFGADLVTVGELQPGGGGGIRVLASWFDGLQLGDFEYDTRATPCHDVLQSGGPQVFLRQVQERYPENGMFAEEGIQAFAGLALKDAEGRTAGLVQAAWRREIGTGLGGGDHRPDAAVRPAAGGGDCRAADAGRAGGAGQGAGQHIAARGLPPVGGAAAGRAGRAHGLHRRMHGRAGRTGSGCWPAARTGKRRRRWRTALWLTRAAPAPF